MPRRQEVARFPATHYTEPIPAFYVRRQPYLAPRRLCRPNICARPGRRADRQRLPFHGPDISCAAFTLAIASSWRRRISYPSSGLTSLYKTPSHTQKKPNIYILAPIILLPVKCFEGYTSALGDEIVATCGVNGWTVGASPLPEFRCECCRVQGLKWWINEMEENFDMWNKVFVLPFTLGHYSRLN